MNNLYVLPREANVIYQLVSIFSSLPKLFVKIRNIRHIPLFSQIIPPLMLPTTFVLLNKMHPSQVMQHITYNEWLPIILGPRVLEIFELSLLPRGHYQVQLTRSDIIFWGVEIFTFSHTSQLMAMIGITQPGLQRLSEPDHCQCVWGGRIQVRMPGHHFRQFLALL